MWFLLQAGIAFAVFAGNIHYGWTPNGYLVAILAYAASYLVTWLIFELRLLPFRIRGLLRRRHVLRDDARRHEICLGRSGWHLADPRQHRGTLRVG